MIALRIFCGGNEQVSCSVVGSKSLLGMHAFVTTHAYDIDRYKCLMYINTYTIRENSYKYDISRIVCRYWVPPNKLRHYSSRCPFRYTKFLGPSILSFESSKTLKILLNFSLSPESYLMFASMTTYGAMQVSYSPYKVFR